MKAVIIGCGSQSMIVEEHLQQDPNISTVGYIGSAEEKEKYSDKILFGGIPFIGTYDVLASLQGENQANGFVVAIGDCRVREMAYYKALKAGLEPINVISRTAIVSQFASLGDGVIIGNHVVIGANVAIGCNTIIESGCIVEVDGKVGDHCYMGPGVICGGGVRVGRNVYVGTGTTIGPFITVGRNREIGVGSTVIEPMDDLPREE